MGLDTRGWIEYSYADRKDRDKEHVWREWMPVDAIIDRMDRITEILFRYSKRIIRKESETESIAKDRGIPGNVSRTVAWEMEEIRLFELKHGPGEIFGFTFIYYDEITAAELTIPDDSPWRKLFAFIASFKAIRGGLQDNQIRLVVWFDW